MSKLITIFGATGQQGGSVVDTIVNHPELSKIWKVRGISRSTTSDKAKALEAKGVEVVEADSDKPESLEKALQGSTAVFAVTNFWEHQNADRERAQGKAIADAAKKNNVDLLIWSSLMHVERYTNGALKHVVHFDAKSDVSDYIKEIKQPYTTFMPGTYMSNFKQSFQADKENEGGLMFVSTFNPDTKLPLYDPPSDTGKFVITILQDIKGWEGKTLCGGSGEWTPIQMAEAVEKVSGKKTRYQQVPDKVFQGFLPPAIAEELVETFALIRDYGYAGSETGKLVAEAVKTVKEPLTSFEEWAEKNGPW